jgi:transcriptional regulator with XRE-family HTH domain
MGGPGSGRKPNAKRWRQAAVLRSQGLSLAQISRRLGVTPQAVSGMIRRQAQDARLPAFTCAACDAVVADRPRAGFEPGPIYCRRCVVKDLSIPVGQRVLSLRLALGLTRQALAERAGISRTRVRLLEGGDGYPNWPTSRGLIRALGIELVGGKRVRYRTSVELGRGAIRCRECGRHVACGSGGFANNTPPYCLSCLARHPEATFGERLRAHRLAAGLTGEALADRAGLVQERVAAYESDCMAPQWPNLVKLVGVLGVGLVDVP